MKCDICGCPVAIDECGTPDEFTLTRVDHVKINEYFNSDSVYFEYMCLDCSNEIVRTIHRLRE